MAPNVDRGAHIGMRIGQARYGAVHMKLFSLSASPFS